MAIEATADSRLDKLAENGFCIRRATAADLDALIVLENATFNSDQLSARQWRRHLASDSVFIVVAADSQSVRGAAMVLFRRNSRIARLYSLAVGFETRGLGIGDSLIAVCEQESRQRGCSRLTLEVRRDNVIAQRLYQRRGYQLFSTRPGYYEDGEDALRFERSLLS